MGKPVAEDGEDGAAGVGTLARAWGVIAKLEQRTARLETMISSQIPASSSSLPPAQPKADMDTSDAVKEYYRAYNEDSSITLPNTDRIQAETRKGAYLHVSSMLALNHSPTFADPEEEGIVDGKEMRRILDDLPRLIPEFFPLDQVYYSLACSHRPILKCCAVHHLGGYTVDNPPSRQAHAITVQLLRNLAVIPAAEPNLDVVLSLVILSFAPASRTDVSLPRTPDPYEASTKALRVSLRLGLNKAALKLERQGVESVASMMNELVLWYASSHRSAWVDLLSADSFIARPSIAPLLCESIPFISATRPDMQHLWMESCLVQIIRPLSNAIADAQCMLAPGDAALGYLLPALREFSTSAALWRQNVAKLASLISSTWLQLHCLQIEMMAYIKVSNEFAVIGRESRAASPGLLQHVRSYSSELRRITLDIVRLVTTSRIVPARLPSYNLTLCFAVYALARPTTGDEEVLMQRFRQNLVDAHVAGEQYVTYLDARRDVMRPSSADLENRHMEDHFPDPEAVLDLSWIFDTAWNGQGGSLF